MVKIKNRPSRGLNKKNRITGRKKKQKQIMPDDPTIRTFWDPSKSTKQNYEALGIRVEADTPASGPLRTQAFSHLVQSSEHIPTQPKLKDWESQILTKLGQVYGKDYKRMAKDIKLNPYQWSSKQLIRMMALLAESMEMDENI